MARLRITARQIQPKDRLNGVEVVDNPCVVGKLALITLVDVQGRRYTISMPPGALVTVHRV